MTSFNQYQLINKCIRLPIKFDAKRALREIHSIPLDMFDSSARGPTHQDVLGIFIKGYPPRLAKPDNDRKILQSLPFISSFIQNSLPGKACKCVIAKLKPNGIIPVHSDRLLDREGQPLRDSAKARYFEDTIRLHIPVVTSSHAYFFNNGEFFNMKAGEVWAINNLAIHGVINEHPSDTRIHLIADILPDEKTEAVIRNSEFVRGFFDQKMLARLMENSMAPADSIYAYGKPVPAHSIIETISATPD